MKLDLQELAKNKPALLAGGAVVVVGLGLYSRSKSGGDTAAPASPAVSAAGSYSNGGQVAGAGGYDSTASDVAAWLHPQLEALRKDNIPTPVPVPLASTLFAPTGTGNYVRQGSNGMVAEIQNDGSLFGITFDQWTKLGRPKATDVGASFGAPVYSTKTNVVAAGAKQPPKP